MDKTSINEALEDFVRRYVSPTQEERYLISKRYKYLEQILPGNEIFQSGSYKRETSKTPVHDLDVIWVMPDNYQEEFLDLHNSNPRDFNFNPLKALNNLKGILESGYQDNNDKAEVQNLQTHSIKIIFGEEEEIDDRFSIDVVPAVKSGKKKKDGEGIHDIYFVPEIQKMGKMKWKSFYESNKGTMKWILSDPKTYIHLSQELNSNTSFRKAVKFIKAWKDSCNAGLVNFELKSFHLELIMMEIFKAHPHTNFIEAVAEFFYTLDRWLEESCIPDEADSNIYVDAYLDDDISNQRGKVLEFAKRTASFFDKFEASDEVDDLYKTLRKSLISIPPWSIPDNCFNKINISCQAELKDKDKLKQPPRPKRFTYKYLKQTYPTYMVNSYNDPKPLRSGEQVSPGFDLRFNANLDANLYDEIKWLIVNNGVDALRKGNIRGWRGNKFEDSEEGTSKRKEHTCYCGSHWVECFAVKDDLCQKHGRFDINIVEKQ